MSYFRAQGETRAIDAVTSSIKGEASATAPRPSAPSATAPTSVVAPTRHNYLLWGAVGLLGVGGFLYYRKRQKKTAATATTGAP